jgi:phosphogluconate dehydratase
VIAEVTERIVERSADTRRAYLDRIDAAAPADGPSRTELGCSNLAHGFAACSPGEKLDLRGIHKPGIAIVSAYNDMLSAHQPLQEFPAWIKEAARAAGGVAQFAGGVPAMCDGITQGRAGMELSLFSREVIAMSTAIALSHDMFDATLLLGVCDKIVPGLLIGALSFGHLPTILVPAGPMASGLPNGAKAKVRQRFATGDATRAELLDAEAASYHSPGTCTFYGTANSNQLVVEVMGLHLPGSTFVAPNTPLRRALTEHAARRAVELAGGGVGIGHMVDERAIVNGVVALLATGGSTNHTMHLVAIAAAAGIQLTWQDFSDLSAAVPLLAKVYPNGSADINHFAAAGGVQVLIRELSAAGMLHEDVRTIAGRGLGHYLEEPFLEDGVLRWRAAPRETLDTSVLAKVAAPFAPDGGLRILTGNLGNAVIKTSAVHKDNHVVRAQARVFDTQDQVTEAFRAGELDRDVVVVLRGQGPRSNGMPELHALTPALGVLQDRGHQVALITDGRMSGASGKIPAAIQLTPEAAAAGPVARLRDGDEILLDAQAGVLHAMVDEAELSARQPVLPPDSTPGTGRELFAALRAAVGAADSGAGVFGVPAQDRASDETSERANRESIIQR